MCEDKDLYIEKVHEDTQEALDECRQEADQMAEEMFRKISFEVINCIRNITQYN